MERIWLRNRSDGELDDTRLVEGVAGERLVFKKRGQTESKKSDDLQRTGCKPAPEDITPPYTASYFGPSWFIMDAHTHT